MCRLGTKHSFRVGHFVKMIEPKFSGTWFGSRLVTHVGCQHLNLRWGSGPSPSMRYRFMRQRVPGLTTAVLTDSRGIFAAAYQIFAFSSMRAAVFQPDRQSRFWPR